VPLSDFEEAVSVNLTASWSAGAIAFAHTNDALERPLTQPESCQRQLTDVSRQINSIQRRNQSVKHKLVMLVLHASCRVTTASGLKQIF